MPVRRSSYHRGLLSILQQQFVLEHCMLVVDSPGGEPLSLVERVNRSPTTLQACNRQLKVTKARAIGLDRSSTHLHST